MCRLAILPVHQRNGGACCAGCFVQRTRGRENAPEEEAEDVEGDDGEKQGQPRLRHGRRVGRDHLAADGRHEEACVCMCVCV